MSDTTYTRMRLDRDGAVARLTLTSPETMNVVDETFHLEMIDAFTEVGKDSDVRVLLMAAEGTVFSAGGDFQFILDCNASLTHRLAMTKDAYHLVSAQLDLDVPIVVAMHGHALGVGSSIVLCSDAVVAWKGAKIGDPHVPVGLVAGDGGCLVWPQTVGMLRAKRHLLTGDPIGAEEAYQFGLVTDLVDDQDQVLAEATALAERLAALPPLAVQLTKRALNRVFKMRLEEVGELALAHELTTLGSDDVREAIAAYKEKRPGNYIGA